MLFSVFFAESEEKVYEDFVLLCIKNISYLSKPADIKIKNKCVYVCVYVCTISSTTERERENMTNAFTSVLEILAKHQIDPPIFQF